jgi:hypothetical protein
VLPSQQFVRGQLHLPVRGLIAPARATFADVALGNLEIERPRDATNMAVLADGSGTTLQCHGSPHCVEASRSGLAGLRTWDWQDDGRVHLSGRIALAGR